MTELTADLFRQIIESSQPPGGERSGSDMRRTPRTPLDVRATLLPFSERFASDTTLSAPVRDLSRGGFGFLHDQPLPLGEQFALLLPEQSGKPIVILCTITYWRPLAKALYAIGARFSRVLRDEHAGLPLVVQDAVSGELQELRKAS